MVRTHDGDHYVLADQAYGIKFVAPALFQCIAKPDGSFVEDHGPETHLLPIACFRWLRQREKIAEEPL